MNLLTLRSLIPSLQSALFVTKFSSVMPNSFSTAIVLFLELCPRREGLNPGLTVQLLRILDKRKNHEKLNANSRLTSSWLLRPETGRLLRGSLAGDRIARTHLHKHIFTTNHHKQNMDCTTTNSALVTPPKIVRLVVEGENLTWWGVLYPNSSNSNNQPSYARLWYFFRVRIEKPPAVIGEPPVVIADPPP